VQTTATTITYPLGPPSPRLLRAMDAAAALHPGVGDRPIRDLVLDALEPDGRVANQRSFDMLMRLAEVVR
jgi:hypothetical protein